MERNEWIEKVARKIDGLYYEWFLDKLTKKDFPEPDERTPLIEAIIAEHCPEEFSEEALRAKTHNESEARFRRTGGSPERGLPSDRAYTGASGNQFDSDVPPDISRSTLRKDMKK